MPALTEKAVEYYVTKGMNELNKKFMPDKGSEISPPNNEIKDIIKVINSAKKLLVEKDNDLILLVLK